MATNDMQESSEPFIPEAVSSHDMAFSNFSQVIFPDIPDFFPPESDISVSYILTDAIEPTSRDWIGLFRVGWASPRDYSTYIWAPKPQNRTSVHTVSFPAYQLPGDDKEFYQFCYVTKQGYVRGASTPFQFRLSTENDCLVAMEDETGMIILRTKSDALEEQLSTLSKEKSSLEETIENMTKEKTDLCQKVQTLETELSATQNVAEASDQKNNELETKIDALNKEISKLEKQLEKKVSQIKTTKSALQAARKTIENLTRQIEDCEELKQNILDEKAASDEKYSKSINEKEAKILEYERNKTTMLDQIKTLTLVKEESQKQCSETKAAQEQIYRVASKAKEDLLAKLQCCKDERDLFKAQLTESELARQESIEQALKLSEELKEFEKKLKEDKEKLKVKEDDIISVTGKLNQLEQKYKHENAKHQELLRNTMDRANAEKTAKCLLSKELSEVTASRDKLLNELTNIKKEKEELLADVSGKLSVINSLQAQLETVEERLAKSEILLLDHEKVVLEEREKAEKADAEMMNQVLVLQKQLKEADSAVAAACDSFPVHKTNRKTQTVAASEDCKDAADEPVDESKAVNDLKSKVEDLTTRLNMGADAYREKFLECHKLEKKLKKLKQVLQTKQDPSSSSASTPETPTGGEHASQGWGTTFEKFIAAITDPDAEAKEQTKQFQVKMEALQKSLETEQGKHRKYKQLFSDEREKLKEAQSAMKSLEEALSKELNNVEIANITLKGENKMLKDQLEEFMKQSNDVRVKNIMTHRRESTSDPSSADVEDDGRDDDIHFEDAVGVPISVKSSSSEISTGSDISDDGSLLVNRTFPKFNICADANEEGGRTNPLTIRRKPGKVISSQPIRSPPRVADVLGSFSSQSTASRSSAGDSHKARKGARNRNNKKSKKVKAHN